MPDTIIARERAESLIEALEETEWTQDEPYDLDFGPPEGGKAGLEGSIGAVSFASHVETDRMSGGALVITYLAYEDYEQASLALDDYASGMSGIETFEAEERTPRGQSRYCADFGGQDECGAVSSNVMIVVLSRLKMMRPEGDPYTEELMDLALGHLREVRSERS